MRRSNYELSTALVGIGAVAVLISLFLNWYGDPGLSAFDVFEVTDWLLVALSVGALVVIGTEAASGGGTANNRLAWICGVLAFLVVAQIIDPPPAARGADRHIGAWLALAGAALMVAGAVLALLEISVTIDLNERDRRRRTAAVDARGDGLDDPSEAPTTTSPAPSASRAGGSSGLWQAPSAPDAGPPPPDARSSTPSSAPKAPADDPDRTQPLKPEDRPQAEGSGGAGDGDAKP